MRRSTRILKQERARAVHQERDQAVRQERTTATEPLSSRKRDATDADLDADDEVSSLSQLSSGDAEIGSHPKFRVAVDLGNSNTAVAVYKDGAPTEEIPTISFTDEPEPSRTNRQVPTLIMYPKKGAQVTGSTKAKESRTLYGHEVTGLLDNIERGDIRDLYDHNNVVSMMKLQLDETQHTSEAKKAVLSNLEKLKRLGHIERNEDVLRDFLMLVLEHTKSCLIRDFGYEEGDTVEIIFSVPVCWKPRANTIMSKAVEDAARKVRLGTDGMSPCNLFIAHEAELQSMHALKMRLSNTLQASEVFVLADCGGATLDQAIHVISQENPLRLEARALQEEGHMLGSMLINEDFRAGVISLLREKDRHRPLEATGSSLETIVDTEIMPKFENTFKRIFEGADSTRAFAFPLRPLKADPDDARFRKNMLSLSSNDVVKFFKPTVTRIISKVLEFAAKARLKGYEVDKIVLTGGFGDSPYLRAEFIKMIDQMNSEWGTNIRPAFAPLNSSATGVAVGGIYRSIDKTNGPCRLPCQSIGILRHIPCDTKAFEKLPDKIRAQKPKQNPDTGVEYIMDTIEWPIKKGQDTLEPVHTVTYLSEFIFGRDEKWVRAEELFASEECMEDF